MPVAPNKARVQLSIDRETWEEFRKNLKDHGLPTGSASYLIQQYMERINLECEHGISAQLEMFGELKR